MSITLQGEIIVGVRYRLKDVRMGVGGTVVIESEHDYHAPFELPEPIAGPIHRVRWSDKKYVANCHGCGKISKPYKRKGEPALFSWAHFHRCGQLSMQEINELSRRTNWRARRSS